MNLLRISRPAMALGVVLACLAVTPSAAAAQQKHGDVNGDGVVSALDAQAILTAVVGLPLPGSFVIANGVAVCDGRALPAALDAQVVLSYVIGLNMGQYCVGQVFGPAGVTVAIAPLDSSLLINRQLRLKATLKDNLGFTIKRPVTWSITGPPLVTFDSIRGDSLAWVRAGTNAGTTTITATADGASFMTQLRVFLSYAGIVITPQRPDTIRQLLSNTPVTLTSRTRDSVGALLPGNPAVNWSIADTAIADFSGTPSTVSASVVGKAIGSTFVRAVNQSNPADSTSIRVVVQLPPVNTCTANTGSQHNNLTYSTPQTWTAATNPHFVTGTLTFNAGSKLTLEPGVLVCMSSFASMTFRAGSRLFARGTVALPITITSAVAGQAWNGIQLGDVFSYGVGAPADTSVLTNALLEYGSNGGLGLSGREQHTLIVDSVRFRQFSSVGARVLGPGSRISRSTMDTVGFSGAFNVTVGRGTVEFTTIRGSGSSAGVSASDTGYVRNVAISGVTTGIGQVSANGLHVNDVTITGASAFSLDLQSVTLHQSSANVQITGGTGGAFRGQIGNLGILYPDSISQATLKGNGRGDSLFVTGGSLTGKTLVVRPDVPWLVNGTINIDTLAQLVVRPGARMAFQDSYLNLVAGGTLDARGEATKFITFGAATTGTFYGLLFNNPGAGGVPALAPTAISQLAFVKVDSAYGIGTPSGGRFCCSAAINAGDRHRVLIDSAIVRKSQQGAIHLSASGSEIKRSLVDTTGVPGNNFIASYPAVALWDGTLMQNTLVRRAGAVGVYAQGTTVRLDNVRIVASTSEGLQAEGGLLAAGSTVRVDSANAYPYRGTVENLYVLAKDSTTQANSFLPASGPGNTDNRLEISGGTLAGSGTLITLTAIPQLPWLVFGSVTVDTLAQLAPRPGAQLNFWNAGFAFNRGGIFNAVGVPGKVIRMKPYQGDVLFYGMTFNDPGPGPNPALAPVAQSQLSYVRVDSATGSMGQPSNGFCCSAAINAGVRHRLIIDSLFVHKAVQGAVWLGASGSSMTNVVVDTTGAVGSGYVSSYSAVAIASGVTVSGLLVRRSGNVGLFSNGTGSQLQNVRVVASQGVALQAESGQLLGALGGFRADSLNAYPYRGTIQNLYALARDSANQATAFLPVAGPGNVDNRVEINAGTFAGTTAPVTITAIPQVPWMIFGNVTIDTLATFAPRPSSTITFWQAGIAFNRGGTLQALGEQGKPITFRPYQANVYFNGLTFNDPGPGPNPALAPTAISQMSFVRLDSATGNMGNTSNGFCCQAAINAGTRHRLLIDSIFVHKAEQGAIWLGAPGSTLTRAVVDTTGPVTNNFVASYAAVAAASGVDINNLLVRRSGQVGLFTNGSARLRNVRIVGSLAAALDAETGQLVGDLGSVRADSANAYAYRGTVQNLAILANDSTNLANSFLPVSGPGNVAQRIEINGSTLSGSGGAPVTLTAIPQIPYMFFGNVTVDTLATFAPRPGATLTFFNAGLLFQKGGTLAANGEAGKWITFRPYQSNGVFNGMTFQDPGPGPNPALAPTAISSIAYARIDSATSNMGNTSNGFCCQAAVNAGVRHRLTMDSIIVHKAEQGAVWLGAYNSSLSRALIDTTGPVSNGFVAAYAAVALGDSVTLSNSLVRRSGQTGVYANGTGARLQNVRVVGSLGVGISAEGGILAGDLATARADSANAYAFRGKIQNLAVLANDSTSQATAFLPVSGPGNASSRLEITSSTLSSTGAAGPLTLTVIPQLPWTVVAAVTIDTNAVLAPRPGSTLNFSNAGFLFQRGGTLNAVGTATKYILFKPAASNVTFNGLSFYSPGAGTLNPTATSTLSFVRLDSATSSVGNPGDAGFCCQSAINGGLRHVLNLDSVIVHKAEQGAIWLGAPGSTMNRSVVDTTGSAPTYASTYAAVALNENTTVTGLLIRRSGATGLYVDGNTISLTGVRIVDNRLSGVQIANNATGTGSNGLTLSGFVVDSNQVSGVGVSIEASNVTVQNCDVLNGFSHGLYLASSYTGTVINNCNIENNGRSGTGAGVFNTQTGATYQINASNNFWGFDALGAYITPAVGGVNGVTNFVTFDPVRTTRRVP